MIDPLLTPDNTTIEDDPNARQSLASNPLTSAWVSASAGTGKTKILTDRVLRLMLPRIGVENLSATRPDKILCLTYTKTAASEMAERIHDRLSKWAVMPDDKLKASLADLVQGAVDPDLMQMARALFARVVDTPNGMKIMTIHSFCQSILKRFPLEAGLPAHFEVLDDRTTQEYMLRAKRRVIAKLNADRDSDLAKSFYHMSEQVNDDQFADLMKDMTSHRQQIRALNTVYPDYTALKGVIYDRLNCAPHDTPQSVVENACLDQNLDVENLRVAVPILLKGGKGDIEKGTAIQGFVERTENNRSPVFNDYILAFLTKELEPRKSLCNKPIAKAHPDILDVLQIEAQRIQVVIEHIRSIRLAQHTLAVLTVGGAIVEQYERIKSAHIQLDYDDLIFYTKKLLSSGDQAGWVLYKMDQGIDHILVDEAQDTSPDQWDIIRALADDFFEGDSARDETLRTIFVVGDEKQSIFSFQGADPRGFQKMRDYFKTKVELAEQSFTPVNLMTSFRSTPAVLKGVDYIFSAAHVRQGVQSDSEGNIRHLPHRAQEAGMVELWPAITADNTDDIAPWTPPIHIISSDTADVRLAFKIAETISHWLETGEKLESQDRAIRAGDIMILFRRRTSLLDHTVRALKQYNIPISGVDRMILTDHLAVQDCLIAAKCALLPEDDLSLATFLRSPFIGYDETQLFNLAYDRDGSLWSGLRDFDAETHDYIKALIHKARSETPYVFFQNLLVSHVAHQDISGRKALYSRLGLEIEDALDEFLNICIDFERLHIPHMQSFLYWFEQGQAEVKREQESSTHNQVRLMTVHASKGLQAPIVFLPDTTATPHNKTQILWPDAKQESNEALIPLWAPRSTDYDSSYKVKRDLQVVQGEEEYKRLLYVAMTRAEDRLYLCGSQGKKKVSDGSWYQICESLLQTMGDITQIPFNVGGEPVVKADTGEVLNALRYTSPQEKPPKDKSKEAKKRHSIDPIPDFYMHRPKAEPSPPRPLAPSRPSDPSPAVRSPLDADEGYKFARGNLVHHLLEILPQLPVDKRQAACDKYLSNPAHELNSVQKAELVREIMDVITDPKFAAIFGDKSRAEVPIVGLLDKHDISDFYAISGQIDRMVVEEQRILIIDYKTNRPPPRHQDDVPAIYWKQMAAYKRVLSSIYPDKKIECALLWTDGPNLMPLDDKLIDSYT